MIRFIVTLLRIRHERPLEGWLAARAQYRFDHPGWL